MNLRHTKKCASFLGHHVGVTTQSAMASRLKSLNAWWTFAIPAKQARPLQHKPSPQVRLVKFSCPDTVQVLNAQHCLFIQNGACWQRFMY